jgi:NAD(P)-dependent dehydrogenase (short-subunit alcohol dehydrogenase family)
VRVNCISPGYTRTELTDAIRKDWRDYWTSVIPMGRMAEVDELVGAVLYLASDAATYTTGTDLIVDGGTTCT